MAQAATVRPPEGALKVFLSHSTQDRDFVERLAIALEENGFTPWRCEVDIDKGENFVAHINDGLAQSQIALLVWSPDAARSAWTKEEWTAALLGRVEGQRMRLGLILLREHDDYPVPPLLRTTNYIDARGDQAAGIRDTITWLKGRHGLQRLSGSKAPVYLPEYRPKDFVGRSTYLATLRDEFFPEPGKFLLYGEPGSGKSTIALQFAWDAQKDLDAVIWQTCGQRSLDTITSELVERLPIEVKTLPPDQQRAAAKEWLRQRQSLLVLDDAWSNDVLQLEPKGACSVLYTSRMQSLPGVAAKQMFKVEKFTDAECLCLFHARLDENFGRQEVERYCEALLDFARRVEMLPIAVAVGASLLQGKSAIALDRGVLKLRLDGLHDGLRDVNALFAKAIASQATREQKLLTACAICVQEGFWMPLAAQIAQLSEDESDEAASSLVHGSLLRVLDRDRQRFQMHALLRAEARSALGQDGLRRLRERHSLVLERLFRSWESRWQECRECLEEILSSAKFLWEAKQTTRQALVSHLGYEASKRVGELDVALRIMSQYECSWIGRQDRDAKHALQAVYANQGVILEMRGELERAMALHKRQEAISRELGDKNGLQVSYCNQALILKTWGRLKEALALHEKEAEICRELGDAAGLASSIGNQASIYTTQARFHEAFQLWKEQEAISRDLGDDEGLQRSYGGQALILDFLGKPKQALALHRKQESLCRNSGNLHGLQLSLGNQANVLFRWGKLQEALELHRKTEEICLKLGNLEGLQRSYANQANILYVHGRFDEAMILYKQQEAICLRMGNRNDLAAGYGNQALILHDLGQMEEAMRLLGKQEEICLELGNQEGLGISYGNQALVLDSCGRTEEAMKLLEREEEICRTIGKSTHHICGTQALMLRRLGRLEEAMLLLKKQEEISLRLGDKDYLQRSYSNQALILSEWGRFEEAFALLRRQENIVSELGSQSSLAYCYWHWGIVAGTQGDDVTKEDKLQQALFLFTELNMPRECDRVQATLNLG